MFRQILQAYQIKQSDRLKQEVQKFFDTHDIESVHQIRVTIKKQRSLHNAFMALFPQEARIFTPESYFKIAGKLRDLQVLHESLEDLKTKDPLFPLFFQYLDDKIPKRMAALENLLQESADELLRYEIPINMIPQEALVTTYKHFIQEKTIKSLELLRFGVFLDFHLGRMHLKQLLYGSTWLGDSPDLDPTRAFIKETEQLIGEWHNLEIAEIQLKKFLKRRPDLIQQVPSILYQHKEELMRQSIEQVQKESFLRELETLTTTVRETT